MIKLPSGVCLGLPHQNARNDPGYYDRILSHYSVDWYNWLFDQDHERYWPMLWSVKSAEKKRNEILAAKSKIGHVWFLGNEPEREGQSDTTPDEFALWVRYWKENIDLPFALPGILWGLYGREWWDAYRVLDVPTPDAYHIHIYAHSAWSWKEQLREALEIFNDKPLVITEVGGWYPGLELQAAIMQQMYTVTALDWIPAAFWFSSGYGEYSDGWWGHTDLFDENENMTEVGEAFEDWSRRKPHNIFLPYAGKGE